ncbi:hypothetical protein C8Q76DRAFT_802487 [Earliella scabrosa]|nr:hypothetical protein C8Q76DRAFT_802487 [Earliella scabrosa]
MPVAPYSTVLDAFFRAMWQRAHAASATAVLNWNDVNKEPGAVVDISWVMCGFNNPIGMAPAMLIPLYQAVHTAQGGPDAFAFKPTEITLSAPSATTPTKRKVTVISTPSTSTRSPTRPRTSHPHVPESSDSDSSASDSDDDHQALVEPHVNRQHIFQFQHPSRQFHYRTHRDLCMPHNITSFSTLDDPPSPLSDLSSAGDCLECSARDSPSPLDHVRSSKLHTSAAAACHPYAGPCVDEGSSPSNDNAFSTHHTPSPSVPVQDSIKNTIASGHEENGKTGGQGARIICKPHAVRKSVAEREGSTGAVADSSPAEAEGPRRSARNRVAPACVDAQPSLAASVSSGKKRVSEEAHGITAGESSSKKAKTKGKGKKGAW